MTALVVYPLLTAAAYYLLSRAKITRFLWSRYPKKLDSFMLCAACTGFWYGLAAASFGWAIGLPFISLGARELYTPLVVALCSIIWTPVVSWLHLAALENLGDPDQAPAEPNSAQIPF